METSDMHMVLVAGASSRTGSIVARDAVRAGLSVRVHTGNEANRAQLAELGAAEVVVGDMFDPEAARRAVEGVDAVLCAIGPRPDDADRGRIFAVGAVNLIEAARTAGVSYMVMETSLGTGNSAGAIHRLFHQVIGPVVRGMDVAERALRASGLSYTILRPGGLTDRAATNDVLVGEGGRGLAGNIPRADVARLMVAALWTPEVQGRTLEIVARDGLRGDTQSVVKIPWRTAPSNAVPS